MMPNKILAALVVGATLCIAQTVGAQSANHAAVVPSTAAPSKVAPIMAEPVPPQVEATFDAWDVDHNGTLSRQEFINGWRQLRQEGAVMQRLHVQFNALDVDKSGSLDAHEYAQMALVKRAGTAAPSFSTFDANKNGRLEFAEYVNLVRQLTAAKPAPATATPAKKP